MAVVLIIRQWKLPIWKRKGPIVITKVKIKIKLYEGTFFLHVFCHVMATWSKALKEYYKWLHYIGFRMIYSFTIWSYLATQIFLFTFNYFYTSLDFFLFVSSQESSSHKLDSKRHYNFCPVKLWVFLFISIRKNFRIKMLNLGVPFNISGQKG